MQASTARNRHAVGFPYSFLKRATFLRFLKAQTIGSPPKWTTLLAQSSFRFYDCSFFLISHRFLASGPAVCAIYLEISRIVLVLDKAGQLGDHLHNAETTFNEFIDVENFSAKVVFLSRFVRN